MKSIKIIAHRGASFDAPENTLASVNLAWRQNINYVEVDVKLTKDNNLVVFHDNTTFRFNQVDKLINQYTLNGLSTVDVGFLKGKKWKEEYIPTLEQVINTIPKNGTLVVELKDGPEMQNALVDLANRNNTIWNQLEFISFNYETICMTKKMFSENKCLWLLDLDYDSETSKLIPSIQNIIHKVKQHNLDGIDVFAGKIADKPFFESIHRENLEIYLWTINSLEHARQYLPFSPHGITTDRPKWLQEQLKKINGK